MNSLRFPIGFWIAAIFAYFIFPRNAVAQSFSSHTDFFIGGSAYSMSVGDFNGDGKPDVAAPGNQAVAVFLNTTSPGAGTPSFSTRGDFSTGMGSRGEAVGDLNGDGKPDIVTANTLTAFDQNYGTTISVFLNTTTPGATTPSFSTKTDFTTSAYPYSVVIGDLNGDGKQDVAITYSSAGLISVFINTTAPGSSTPSFSSRADFTSGSYSYKISMADLNGDGKLDIVSSSPGSSAMSLFINSTTPGSSTPSFTRTDVAVDANIHQVAFGDLNGDGKTDVAIDNSSSKSISVLFNTTTPGSSTPSFSTRTDYSIGSSTKGISIGDVNNDGKPDVAALGSDAVVYVFINTTSPGASSPSFSIKNSFTSYASGAIALADFNGDGRLDLASAGGYLSIELNTTPLSNGTASFASETAFGTGSFVLGAAVGDLNGDGKPDLVTANNSPQTVSVLLNTTSPGGTTPSFSTKTDFTSGSGTGYVSIGDLNGDGKPDLAVASSSADSVNILLNTTSAGATTPSFSAKTDFATGKSPAAVEISDMNRDGKPDLVVTDYGYLTDSVSILFNTTVPGAATPTFTTQKAFTTTADPQGVSIADLNGDGAPDLVLANGQALTISVYISKISPGDTAVSFTSELSLSAGFGPTQVAIADFNGDGKPDLAACNPGASSTIISVYLNTTTTGDTTASFTTKTNFTAGSNPTSIASVDFNGDGKPDLVAVNFSSNTVSVLLNTTSTGATSPSFSTKSDFSVTSTPAFVSIGDFNGDGKKDLAVTKRDAGAISVLLNTATISTPTISTLSPNDGDTTGNNNLVITFNESVTAQSGKNVTIYNGNGTPFEQIPANDSRITVSGGEVTINPTADFLTGNYYLLMDAGAFANSSSVNYAGIANTGTWNFSVVADNPVVQTLSPADGDSISNGDTVFVVTFNKSVTAQSGKYISIYTGSNTLLEYIPADDARVSVSGAEITIDPSSTIPAGTYSIRIDAGAFKDTYGNSFAGITNDTIWNGTVDASMTDDVPGYALAFTGETTGHPSNYVQVPYTSALNPSDNFTVEAWAKVEGNGGTYRCVIGSEGAGGYALYADFNDKWGVVIDNSGTPTLYEGSSVTLNTWTHAAFTYSSGTLKIYVNGVLTQTASSISFAPNPANPFRIGDVGEDPGYLPFNGKIDEVRIWNVVRTEQQIREYMHRTVPGSSQGLVAYFQLNEGTGTTTDDVIGGFIGTVTGSPSWVASTIPLGNGIAATQSSFTTGTANLGTVSMTMTDDFDSAVDLTGTEIGVAPDATTGISGTPLSDRYWVINAFGTPGTFAANLTFTVPSAYTNNGLGSAANYTLYHREGNANSSWTATVNGASNITATTLTFNNVTSFSQFAIGTSENVLPVELISFTVTSERLNAKVQWQTATEINSAGFAIERKSESINNQKGENGWVRAGFVEGNGTSNTMHSYSFTDKNIPAGAYSYRLKQIDRDGNYEYSNTVEVFVGAVPLRFELSQNYPNPFNPSTTIQFTLQQDGLTTLRIYNILGQEVVTLVNEMLKAGEYHATVFDGSRFASGIYFMRLQSGSQVQLKKMMLVK